jgi:mannose-6-phosphate isomerase-like protein (cupin superfamily)
MAEPLLTSIADAEETVMRLKRGITKHLVGPRNGARLMDMHINILNRDSGMGPYHFHQEAENVYLVLEGIVHIVIDGVFHELKKDDVAFIPPGVPHAAGSSGEGESVLLEIYAPAGRDFHIVSHQPPGWD